jgi:hypothetical protein
MGEKNTIFFGRKEETIFSFLVEKRMWAKRGRSFLSERSTARISDRTERYILKHTKVFRNFPRPNDIPSSHPN